MKQSQMNENEWIAWVKIVVKPPTAQRQYLFSEFECVKWNTSVSLYSDFAGLWGSEHNREICTIRTEVVPCRCYISRHLLRFMVSFNFIPCAQLPAGHWFYYKFASDAIDPNDPASCMAFSKFKGITFFFHILFSLAFPIASMNERINKNSCFAAYECNFLFAREHDHVWNHLKTSVCCAVYVPFATCSNTNKLWFNIKILILRTESFRYLSAACFMHLCVSVCQSVSRKIGNSCTYKHRSLFLLFATFSSFLKKVQSNAFLPRSDTLWQIYDVTSFVAFWRRSCSLCEAATCNKSFRKIFAKSINQFSVRAARWLPLNQFAPLIYT